MAATGRAWLVGLWKWAGVTAEQNSQIVFIHANVSCPIWLVVKFAGNRTVWFRQGTGPGMQEPSWVGSNPHHRSVNFQLL